MRANPTFTRMLCAALCALSTLPALAQGQAGLADLEPGQPGRRYIVGYRDAVQGSRALRAAGAALALSLPQQRAAAAYIPDAALRALGRNPNIAYIEPDVQRFALAQSTPYGIAMVQALEVAQAASSDVALCIIDSGYGLGHEDLQGTNVTFSRDSGSGDAATDGCGHGTHVAGTIAALQNDRGVLGVNPTGDLALHIVKVFGDNCSWAYSSSLVAALNECRAAASKVVVNMSLGGSYASTTERNAFAEAYNSGNVLPIAAAGNDGTTRYSYPASYPSVVSVAAIDSARQKAWFSQANDQVELSAPGVGVMSTVPWGGYEAWSGTSMATPHVAGVAALVWNRVPSATASDIRDALNRTALDLGAAGRDTATGYGLVQAKAALDAFTAEPPPPPPVCTPTESVESSCADGIDNDCNGLVDADDSSCLTQTCWESGVSCSRGSDCCSGSCRKRRGGRVCR